MCLRKELIERECLSHLGTGILEWYCHVRDMSCHNKRKLKSWGTPRTVFRSGQAAVKGGMLPYYINKLSPETQNTIVSEGRKWKRVQQ